ncbi:MAG: hypothetical protein J6V00_05400 [Bacteroidaceae bacterium]|nr:hypothetical protein [Bacteroidaceae bacterium]
MRTFLQRLLAVSFIATIIFASGDTTANLIATVISAATAGCCQWKLNKMEQL